MEIAKNVYIVHINFGKFNILRICAGGAKTGGIVAVTFRVVSC